MRSILTSLTFWFFLVWSCVVLGGSLYESAAVWTLIAADLPRSLAATNQALAVPERAGMLFWSWATPGLGLVGLVALLTSFGVPQPDRTWRIASIVLMLVVVAATFLYFRPTIIGLVVGHGGGLPDDAPVGHAELGARGRTGSFHWHGGARSPAGQIVIR